MKPPEERTFVAFTALMVGLVVVFSLLEITYQEKRLMGWISFLPRHRHTRDIAFDSQGQTWIGGYGVVVYDEDAINLARSKSSGIPSLSSNVIEVDQMGRVWVGGSSEIHVFDENEWITYTKDNSGFDGTAIHTIVFDRAGRAWVGCWGQDYTGNGKHQNEGDGIYILDGTTWLRYSAENSDLLDEWINTIAFDEYGRAWIGTRRGVSVFDGKNWTNYTSNNSGLIHDGVYMIAIDKQGRAWIGTAGGLSVFDGKTWVNYTEDNSNLTGNIVAVAIDKVDRVWVSSFKYPSNSPGVGLHMFDGKTWRIYNEETSGIASNLVDAISVDKAGRVWIGTDDKGISIFDFQHSQPIPQGVIVLREYTFAPRFSWVWFIFVIGLWYLICIGGLPGWLVSFAVACFSVAVWGPSPIINPGIFVSIGGIVGAIIGREIDKRSGKRSHFWIHWNLGCAILGMVLMAIVAMLLVFIMAYGYQYLFGD